MFRKGTRCLKLASEWTSVICGGILVATGAFAGPMTFNHPAFDKPPVARVTFWGHPYPYGYAYVYRDRSCLERSRIKTAHGWVWKKVWVCNDKLVTK